jgi:hypothetical protein
MNAILRQTPIPWRFGSPGPIANVVRIRQRYQLYGIVFFVWLVILIVSPFWLRRFRFGPLEWLWRSLTYWEKQPFRRDSIVGPSAGLATGPDTL